MRKWEEGMGEISGFGGSYEDGCRAMVLAGIQWIDEHPNADPQFAGYKGVFGIIEETNDDAKALTAAIMDARCMMDGKEIRCGDECTGAMHHASINHVMNYKRIGWDEYRRIMSSKDKDGD